MRTCPSHEVNDGGHLLHQGQGVFLTHPQCPFEPDRNMMAEQTTNRSFDTENSKLWVREYEVFIAAELPSLLLCSNAQFNGPADVSVAKVKIRIKIFLWSDGSGVGGSRILQGQVL